MVERLKAAGAIMLGKTNTPTFGWIGATHNLLFGATRNPWNLDRTPGGSSGGAARRWRRGWARSPSAPTAAAPSASPPRAPASSASSRPTAAIPIYPASGAWSLSHVGPMTRTVADAALMMNVCAGPDERDQYSLPADGADYVKALSGGVKGLRVAYTDDLGFATAVDPEVEAAARGRRARSASWAAAWRRCTPSWPSPERRAGRRSSAAASPRAWRPYLDRRDDIEPGLLPIIEAR